VSDSHWISDFAEDKLTILDIKAVDAQERIFNVEMQLTVSEGLLKRIVFYGCETYSDQLHKGFGQDTTCHVLVRTAHPELVAELTDQPLANGRHTSEKCSFITRRSIG
jgi:hypothetical protein